MVFDDIFFIYYHAQEVLESFPNTELSNFLQSSQDSYLKIIGDFPHVIVPEKMYETGYEALLLNQGHPYILPASYQCKVETWPSNYIKCIYYLPLKYIRLHSESVHLYSILSDLSKSFFDKRSSGIWSFRIQNKLYSITKMNNLLQEVKTIRVDSPDDSTFYILKLVEKYSMHQPAISVWTNETNAHHVRILKKYVSEVILERRETVELVKEIMKNTCASFQEN